MYVYIQILLHMNIFYKIIIYIMFYGGVSIHVVVNGRFIILIFYFQTTCTYINTNYMYICTTYIHVHCVIKYGYR